MRYYDIGGAKVAIDFADKELENFCQNYKQTNIGKSVDMQISVKIVANISIERTEPQICASGIDVFFCGDKYIAYYGKPSPRVRVEYTEDFSIVEIYIADSDDIYRPNKLIEYMLLGQFFYDMLNLKNGLMLHGSAICYKGNGIIFTAPCGTGKSTHSRLWKEVFGDDVTIINDDKPAILFEDSICVAGTPFCGKEGINANIIAPLKAIVYLKQGKSNCAKQVFGKEALFCLYEQIQKNMSDARLMDASMTKLGILLKNIPVYILECLPDKESVEVCRQALKIY